MYPFRPVKEALHRPARLGVLISGGGTTMLNFLDKIAAGELDAEIALVVSSQRDCKGIQSAAKAGLETEIVSRGKYSSVADFSDAIFALLRDARVDLVTMAGFLTLIRIPEDFRFRVMNIHPSLIPLFCGAGFFGHKVHEAALDRGVKVSGCTVHFADNEYDEGPIICQKSVPVLSTDTPDSLAERVFKMECEAYPEAIGLFAAGKLEIVNNRVNVLCE